MSAVAAPRAKAVASRVLRRRRLPAHLRAVDRIEGMISLHEADLLYRLAARANGCGCIVEIVSAGALSRVSIDASGTPIVAAVTARSVRELQLAPGVEVVAGFKATAVHLC